VYVKQKHDFTFTEKDEREENKSARKTKNERKKGEVVVFA
jgi:hypothetical protein